MNNILILYPKAFNCYSKFSRKILNIIQRLDGINFYFPNDPNDFIQRFSKENKPVPKIIETSDWKNCKITHAIIFDDGEEFVDETNFIKSNNIPFRLIIIKITRVININKELQYKNLKSTPSYEYIGRGSYWGNPYSMYDEGENREEVIRKFKYDFDFDKFPKKIKSEVYKLSGKRLGCFCKPELCHGDILADFLNTWDDGA